MKVKMNQILTAVSLVVTIFGTSQAQAHCSWEHPGHCVGIGGGPGTGGGVTNKIKDPNFQFSYAGAIAGKQCISLNEPADIGATWGDNYLCTDYDIGLNWNIGGAPAGQNCLQVYENAEPLEHTWNDNYLCQAPDRIRFPMLWSQAGAVDGWKCVSFNEPADPHTWGDNFLCYQVP
ncbi:MAG TPA: hypothetical protein VE954_30815 [Oligoflexus sp.]|uniref:hypothetical protein n=1 Tax=Oligoflexus sp. TaxID=1971216 RepID=UPI002D2F7E1A|nr:hypothetical protein [Oligoflexus sp.]HYX37517.1 hypothetical protein [Oligoflexus sp.]